MSNSVILVFLRKRASTTQLRQHAMLNKLGALKSLNLSLALQIRDKHAATSLTENRNFFSKWQLILFYLNPLDNEPNGDCLIKES